MKLRETPETRNTFTNREKMSNGNKILSSLKSYRQGVAYILDGLYLAPTSRSPALRTMRDLRGSGFVMRRSSGFSDDTLTEEATSTELSNIVNEFYKHKSDLGSMGENDKGVVFQGPGDPLMAYDVVLDTVKKVSEVRNAIPFRLNTFGLCAQSTVESIIASDVVLKGDSDARRDTRISVVSVFLPASNPNQ